MFLLQFIAFGRITQESFKSVPGIINSSLTLDNH